MEEPYIAALDVGTTTIRCHIVNTKCQTIGVASEKIELLYPESGFVEIDPEKLWLTARKIISDAIKDSSLSPGQISGIGITTQRSTFTTWNKTTGEPFHNFITWKDLRASLLVKEWDNCLTLKVLRAASYVLYLITKSKRYLAGSVIHFTNSQITLRLLWALKNIEQLKTELSRNNVMFGTIESWLIYKLTNKKKHVTDITNASATGLFDPFILDWSPVLMKIFKIPPTIYPQVVDNITSDLGYVDQSIFGVEIPIVCSVADQSAAIFGSCCFKPGDIKITMGTGGFLDFATGIKPHASVAGVYPLVGWKIGNELAYVAEGAINDVGSLIEWALLIGLITTADESAELAIKSETVVYFIPAFSGLGAPINDSSAATGFIGIKPNTTKACLVRAILESIVFRLYQLYEVVLNETGTEITKIKVDGGVSKNNFICQLLADLTNLPVERATTSEMTVLGVVYLSGMRLGFWKSKDDLVQLREVSCIFQPNKYNAAAYQSTYTGWLKALERFQNWY